MKQNPVLGCGSYPWLQIYQRQNRNWADHLPEILAAVQQSGLRTWEQPVDSAAAADSLGQLAAVHDLQLLSIYAGGVMHTGDWEAVVDHILQQAGWMKPHGTRIVVVNPDPIAWGQPLAKDDPQLRIQLKAMQSLGRQLAAEGFELAYHTHDPEMLHGAREFHHMMLHTDPATVGWCLDSHWIWRGCGNSQVALNDCIHLYGNRIRSVHLRQSHGGVWDETFGAEGDIDHAGLRAKLLEIEFVGPLILEQAFEEGTPTGRDPQDNLRAGRAAMEQMLAE